MYRSCITISRQYGSGGRFIGQKLAERLNIPFYDNELITLAAKKSGYAEQIFEKADQLTTHSLLYSLSMFGSSAGVYGLPLSDKVFIIQSDIIKKVAEEGPCVIVGRCADYILKEHPNMLNIFIHSDLKSRVARAVKYYGLAEKGAEEAIHKTDKKRAAYYSYYTSTPWGQAENYHLSIHSDAVGVDQCVDVIKAFVEAREQKQQADVEG